MDQVTRDRVIQFIGLLGSDHDGEILAAARALQRLLKSSGLTFGDVKIALSEGKPLAPRVVYVERPRAQNPHLDTAEELWEVREFMQQHERKFLRDMRRRMQADPEFIMTERQGNWFYVLYSKYVH